MKRVFKGVMVCVMGIVGFVAFKFLDANERLTPQATTIFSSDELNLSVNYSRPSLRGTNVFGRTFEYGAYWNTGSNATELSFDQDVLFGNVPVKRGTYRLYLIPGLERWVVALNSETGQWGSFEPNEALDVVRIEVTPDIMSTKADQLTMRFEPHSDEVELVIKWDDTRLGVLIQ